MARINAWISKEEFESYQKGKTAFAVCAVGKKQHPQCLMNVLVHASEVVSINEQTGNRADHYNVREQFLTYDIRRLNGYGD